MRRHDENRYIYSASANSFGAAIHSPLKAFLTDAPSAASPVTGGLNSYCREKLSLSFGCTEIIRIGHASASVLAEEHSGHYVTQATASVENINILNVVTADRIVAKVTSYYPTKPDSEPRDKECHPSRFHITGSYFDNLRINGRLIHFQPKEVEDDKGFQLRYAERVHVPICNDHVHHIPEFGSVYLGEKTSYGGKLILNMLRIEFGCSFNGSSSGPGATSNGSVGRH